MSRSLHTQKLSVRAQRRLERPYSKRREEARRLSGREHGTQQAPIALPRRHPVQTRKAPPGMQHPLALRDIQALIERLGPASLYGLKTIRFRPESALRAEGIVFAEYAPPGEIHLYTLPASPWRLSFLLTAEDREAFEGYDARLEIDLDREQTTIYWSADGLKRFMLYEVLAHELGHHLLQHHKGKRKATLCRRSDHEKRADLQSRRAQKMAERGIDHHE